MIRERWHGGWVEVTDRELELEALGGMLLDHALCGETLRKLKAADFATEDTAGLFRLISRAYEAGRPTDEVGVLAEIRRDGDATLHRVLLDAVGHGMPVYGLARAEEVRRLARIRRLAAAGVDISALADGPGDVDEMIAKAESMVTDLAEPGDGQVVAAYDLVNGVFGLLEMLTEGRPKGVVPTGIQYLDRKLNGGLWPGHLVIVGARPSVGKSALACNVTVKALQDDVPVLFASLEMSASEVGWRMALDIAGQQDTAAVLTGAEFIGSKPLRVLTAPLSIAAIRAEARRMKPEGLGLVVVDYVQLLSGSRRDNRALEVGEYARGLKILARELDVPVLALAQLNREVESRQDGKPRLSDLRDSGELEQHADEVMLLHRPNESADAELNLAKQRNGPTGIVRLSYRPAVMRFTESRPLPDSSSSSEKGVRT